MKLPRWVLLGALAGCASEPFSTAATQPQVVTPPCPEPAPLLGQFDPQVGGFIVMYQPGTDGQAETDRLASKYDFTPRFVYTHGTTGFSAALQPEVLAAVRCEISVSFAEYNGRVSTAGL